MAVRFTVVDAFTAVPFTGNPAGICVLDAPREEGWMQRVARELNLSETAFLWPHLDGYSLRWFTPSVEVELCGHATLDAAHALWEEGHLGKDREARFHTLSGLLTATREAGWITLDFPVRPATGTAPPPRLLEALGGITPAFVGANRHGEFLLELASEEQVRALRPDLSLLEQLPPRVVIVTARSRTPGVDIVSRVFAPAQGIPEDPVTGSAHCALAPHWVPRLDKNPLVAQQASARGGLLRVALAGERVRLGGQALTMIRGELLA